MGYSKVSNSFFSLFRVWFCADEKVIGADEKVIGADEKAISADRFTIDGKGL